MSEQTRILVVDDETNITDLVATALRYEGFEVDTAATGRSALAATETFRPHLVVLDVMLPDLDGFEILSRLRNEGRKVPVLFLTARDTVEDRVRGLTTGGDDYLTKPFSIEELVARIRAILRRVGENGDQDSRLVFADLELDDDTHEVWRGGAAVELTATEFKLLRYLMTNPRRVLSKAQILDHVWNYDFGGDMNVVETYISYLRKKIDANGPPLIHTIRGVGYSLRQAQGVTMSLRARLLLGLVALAASACSPPTSRPIRRCGPSWTSGSTQQLVAAPLNPRYTSSPRAMLYVRPRLARRARRVRSRRRTAAHIVPGGDVRAVAGEPTASVDRRDMARRTSPARLPEFEPPSVTWRYLRIRRVSIERGADATATSSSS